MAANIQAACFRYFGQELVASLNSETTADADVLVRCLVRQRTFAATPEERVRQALIWFLFVGARSAGYWRDRLRFEVEQRSLDVAAFLLGEKTQGNFAFNLPVLVVETKRQDRGLRGDLETEEQLKIYMIRERCRSGLMFNAQEAAWLSMDGSFGQARSAFGQSCLAIWLQ